MPSETFESNAFARWLSRQDALLFSKIPIGDSTLTGQEGAKLRAMGVRRGVPDFVIVHVDGRVLWLEMKRASKGVLSSYQRRWLAVLDKSCTAVVAYGYKEARKKVEDWAHANGFEIRSSSDDAKAHTR